MLMLLKILQIGSFLKHKQCVFPLSNIVLLILQQILQSHPFLMSQNFAMQGFQWVGMKWIKSIFAGTGNSGTRFGDLFITSCSSYLFN